MADKKSFLIHKDSLNVLDELTNEEAGKLLKAIQAFHCGLDFDLDTLTKITFAPFKAQFIRDNEKYDKTCSARAASGSKGGLAKASNSYQKLANGSKTKQTVAKLAESDKDSDSDKESDKDIKDIEKLDWSKLNSNDEGIEGIKKCRKDAKLEIKKGDQRALNMIIKQTNLCIDEGYSMDQILNEWSVHKKWALVKPEYLKGKVHPETLTVKPMFSDRQEAPTKSVSSSQGNSVLAGLRA